MSQPTNAKELYDYMLGIEKKYDHPLQLARTSGVLMQLQEVAKRGEPMVLFYFDVMPNEKSDDDLRDLRVNMKRIVIEHTDAVAFLESHQQDAVSL